MAFNKVLVAPVVFNKVLVVLVVFNNVLVVLVVFSKVLVARNLSKSGTKIESSIMRGICEG
ncbi:MAG: hypothetical protein CMB97_00275 [Flavobacteriaceae bacterium]|nr:hypothetical protein [Flavobacteriaceae bacterium]